MKKTVLLLALFVALNAGATKYYFATGGSDVTGNGTIGNKWASPLKAGQMVYYPDTIVAAPGSYTASLMVIHAGVSLIKEGTGEVIFNCPYFGGDLIQLGSVIVNTYGQTIKGITFEGNNVARGCLVITNRCNIIIEDCIFRNFSWNAVDFYNTETTPVVYNQIIRRNRFINCSKYVPPGSPGALWIRGNKDIRIEFNYIECTYRAGDSAGFGLKTSYTQNLDSYGNRYSVPNHNDDLRSAFAIELNNNLGGSSFSYDTIEGVFDIAGRNTLKGIYDTAVSVHDCYIGQSSLQAMNRYGIYLEANEQLSDVYMFDNFFFNVEMVLRFTPLLINIIERVYFFRNLCFNIGRSDIDGYGYAIRCGTAYYPGAILNNIFIDNNVFKAATVRTQVTALSLPAGIPATNIYYRNNVVQGFDNAPVLTVGTQTQGSISGLYLQNNIFFENGNSNNPKWWGIVPETPTITNNLKVDPLFISTTNFRLQTNSPCIDAGINVGRPYYYSAPDIGVYEYQVETPAVASIVTLSAPLNITAHTLYLLATVAYDGGGTVSARGICYGPTINPTISGSKVANGTGLGSFYTSVTGLTNSTLYYVRAYSTNEFGTSYSDNILLRTNYSSAMYHKGKLVTYKGKELRK